MSDVIAKFGAWQAKQLFGNAETVLAIQLGKILELWDPKEHQFMRSTVSVSHRYRQEAVPLSFADSDMWRVAMQKMTCQSLGEGAARLVHVTIRVAREFAKGLIAEGHKPLLFQNRTLRTCPTQLLQPRKMWVLPNDRFSCFFLLQLY